MNSMTIIMSLIFNIIFFVDSSNISILDFFYVMENDENAITNEIFSIRLLNQKKEKTI